MIYSLVISERANEMRKIQFAYVVIAAVWLILTMLPIPLELLNQVRLVKIALILALIFISTRKKN